MTDYNRARNGAYANTFRVTAVRRYRDQEPRGKDFKGDDYYLDAFEFQTDEHPGWWFGVGGDETSFAYRLDDEGKVQDLTYMFGWSNWGPYWEPDPYVYEKFPALWNEDGSIEWQKDTWPEDWPDTERNYYSVSEDLLHVQEEDIKILEERLGHLMDDQSTWYTNGNGNIDDI